MPWWSLESLRAANVDRIDAIHDLIARLEEKARQNPAEAPRLTELARKLRVGAAMLILKTRARG